MQPRAHGFGLGRPFPIVLIVRAALGVAVGSWTVAAGSHDAGSAESVVRTVGAVQVLLALLLVWCGAVIHRRHRDVSIAVTLVELANIGLLAVLPLSHVPEVLMSMAVLGALYLPGTSAPITTAQNVRAGIWGLLVIPLTVAAFFLGLTIFGTDSITGKAELDQQSLRLALGFMCSSVAFASLSRLLARGR